MSNHPLRVIGAVLLASTMTFACSKTENATITTHQRDGHVVDVDDGDRHQRNHLHDGDAICNITAG